MAQWHLLLSLTTRVQAPGRTGGERLWTPVRCPLNSTRVPLSNISVLIYIQCSQLLPCTMTVQQSGEVLGLWRHGSAALAKSDLCSC